jgi:S1-C subfamily serine protease
MTIDTSVVYLDVLRGKTEITLRVVVHPGSRTAREKRERVKEALSLLSRFHDDAALGQLTRGGAPSGVLLHHPILLAVRTADDDVLRRVDGVPVLTVEQAISALEAAADHRQVVLDLERLGQPFSLTLTLEDEAQLSPEVAALAAKITKVNDTTYEVPKGYFDGVAANPDVLVGEARIVPAISDGKPDGFKLYAIRPKSPFAALGLQNGDTIRKLNGVVLTGPDRALEAIAQARGATKLELELSRRGEPMTLVWMVK